MRSLSRDARHERRVQVVRLRKVGQTYDEIAAQTGLSRTGVFDICKRHEATGAKALRDAPSGRKVPNFADPDFVREEGRILDLGFSLLEPYGLDWTGKIHALRGIRSLAHGFADIEASGGFGLDVSCEESFSALSELLIAGLKSRGRNV